MKSKLIFFFSLICLISCNKQPTSEFETDKTSYTAGDVVKLTNRSIDARSYKWTMPDGQTSSSQNVDYTISQNEPDGTLTFKLEAISKKGNKKSESSKSVTVKAAAGSAMFWNCVTCNGNLPIYVTINGVTKNITNAYSSSPSCGTSDCANFSLKVGTYNYSATDNVLSNWNGTITVKKDVCTKIQLQ